MHRAGANQFKETAQRTWQACDNTRKNDNRNAIAQDRAR